MNDFCGIVVTVVIDNQYFPAKMVYSYLGLQLIQQIGQTLSPVISRNSDGNVIGLGSNVRLRHWDKPAIRQFGSANLRVPILLLVLADPSTAEEIPFTFRHVVEVDGTKMLAALMWKWMTAFGDYQASILGHPFGKGSLSD